MSQKEIRIIGETKTPEMVPMERIKKCKTRHQAIQLCVAWSGLQNSYIADALGIDHGQFTRIMGGSAHFPDRLDDQLMVVCGNYAPIQYSAWRHGFDLVEQVKDERIKELEAELTRLKSKKQAA